MKTITALIFLILLFGGYMAATHRANPIPPKGIEDVKIIIEDIDNTLKDIPPVLEINYCETEKDIHNWFILSDEKNSVHTGLSDNHATQGTHSMKIEWNTDGWAELVLVHFPEEWDRYQKLSFEIFNPNAEIINFEIKVSDYFDASSFYVSKRRFAKKNSAMPGLNSYEIRIGDIAEEIDITSERKVLYIRLFEAGSTLYLDNVRLSL